jgi:2-dehydro-3-deoxyphosphogluconate aldolase / (4S)-4-hydroxy-2-oxoglutarate aldolase
MAKFTRLNVLNAFHKTGFVPIFYYPDLEVAKRVASACHDGGSLLLEFTNRGDHAVDIFIELEKHCANVAPDLILGAGSIIDPHTAAIFIQHGANFVVGPILNPDVAKLCNRHKIPYIPGCGTSTEISNAEELGCEIIKIFPTTESAGPGFVKSILGPCPWTSIMPTGGVNCTDESLRPWFTAGVACVGIGGNLISTDIVNSGDYTALRDRVAMVAALISKIRGEIK